VGRNAEVGEDRIELFAGQPGDGVEVGEIARIGAEATALLVGRQARAGLGDGGRIAIDGGDIGARGEKGFAVAAAAEGAIEDVLEPERKPTTSETITGA
jgi:hypothetical protein